MASMRITISLLFEKSLNKFNHFFGYFCSDFKKHLVNREWRLRGWDLKTNKRGSIIVTDKPPFYCIEVIHIFVEQNRTPYCA
uniref:Uncharacterized protein n=1 Tax=Serratia marcescens TaxID=615 RepID=A0A1C3HKT2_SERMA|nr:Uncharacterised protein [Serratia marcescens]